jgi:hypothetical protein
MSTLKADTVQSTSGGAVTLTNQEASKAWVQATDAAALSDSFNISGGTDNGTGDYTYALSNNMGNNQWSQTCNAISAEIAQVKNATLLTSAISVAVFSRADSFAAADQRNFVTLHGDLA